MFSEVVSAALLGVDAYLVKVESHLENGVNPPFNVVGLPDSAVKESRERVSAAIKNSGFVFPNRKITVNLAPADIRKEGSAFDLPMAVGILIASGQLAHVDPEKTVLLGELALDGKIRPMRGALPIANSLKGTKHRQLVVPEENASEAAMIEGIDVYSVTTLRDAVDFLNGDKAIAPISVDRQGLFAASRESIGDFGEVRGQASVKRALEIAAAGGHNLLMIGPPGSGKTMLARRLPSILPEFTMAEALETTRVHSVAGMMKPGQALVANRPFRSPHHTVSDAGLIGGGMIPRPGEVSLAHNGVLFLDELPEFHKNVLEVLRQPLEDGVVTLSRAAVSLTYPANFMLVAAMNPCPCGYYTDPDHECKCTPEQVNRYLSRVSGPLLDRIDIHVEVPRVPVKHLSTASREEESGSIQSRVSSARQRQSARFKNVRADLYSNSQMTNREIERFAALGSDSLEVLHQAMDRMGLSARAYHRIRKISRTIADMEGSEEVALPHVIEAVQYRSLDRVKELSV